MLEVFAFFRNELKFSLRQGGLLYLLFLYPLFVIAIVGYAFNSPPSITVPIGIYSDDARFADAVSGYKGFIAHAAPTPYEAENLVRKGIVPASIIVTKCDYYFKAKRDFYYGSGGQTSCEGPLYIVFVQDQSRISEVSFLKIVFESALRDKLSLSAREILQFQTQAVNIQKDIPKAKNEIASLRKKLQDEKNELASINNGIDLNEIQNSLNGLDETLQFFDSAQRQSSQSIAEMQNLKADIYNQNAQLSNDLSGFQTKLINMQNQVQ
ncbi:MAG: hypothetical protein QW568_05535, partial [Candidatus Anstonellaceae archaeon]